MRISDWSSDVCSSDLRLAGATKRSAIRRDKRVGRRLLVIALTAKKLDAGLGCHIPHVTFSRVRYFEGNFQHPGRSAQRFSDRKSVVSGKSGSLRVDLGGCRYINKNKKSTRIHQ